MSLSHSRRVMSLKMSAGVRGPTKGSPTSMSHGVRRTLFSKSVMKALVCVLVMTAPVASMQKEQLMDKHRQLSLFCDMPMTLADVQEVDENNTKRLEDIAQKLGATEADWDLAKLREIANADVFKTFNTREIFKCLNAYHHNLPGNPNKEDLKHFFPSYGQLQDSAVFMNKDETLVGRCGLFVEGLIGSKMEYMMTNILSDMYQQQIGGTNIYRITVVRDQTVSVKVLNESIGLLIISITSTQTVGSAVDFETFLAQCQEGMKTSKASANEIKRKYLGDVDAIKAKRLEISAAGVGDEDALENLEDELDVLKRRKKRQKQDFDTNLEKFKQKQIEAQLYMIKVTDEAKPMPAREFMKTDVSQQLKELYNDVLKEEAPDLEK